MTVRFMTGTPGSGKSYHMLEEIIAHLEKGKPVIANFPLNFTEGMARKGFYERFMFVPDDVLMGARGVSMLINLSVSKGWFDDDSIPENYCMLVMDECSNHFPPEQSTNPVQKVWQQFFRQHRKLKYEPYLISQDKTDISKRINSVVEYHVDHRCVNSVFPFSLLPFKIFAYVTYWKRSKISTGSTILVKRFANLYKTHRLFGQIDKDMERILALATEDEMAFECKFGNLLPADVGDAQRGEHRPTSQEADAV
ncbi:Zonular occludens toxin (Zot) [compost metagenome]